MIAEQKLFDLSYLEQMDDKNFITEVIVVYLQGTHNDLGKMKWAFDAGAIDIVYNTAHKLKSSTGILQANNLFAILEQTENMAKAGEKNSQLAELVQTARHEFDQLKSALELHLESIYTTA